MSTIRERVEAGAALLDQEEPGWESEIDLDRLHLDDPCRCILGQLFGVYHEGTGSLGIDWPRTVELGFFTARTSYLGLDRAWKALIRQRLAEATSQEAEGERP